MATIENLTTITLSAKEIKDRLRFGLDGTKPNIDLSDLSEYIIVRDNVKFDFKGNQELVIYISDGTRKTRRTDEA